MLLPVPAAGQLLDYTTIARPGNISYQVLSTAHFDIIFQRGYLDEAQVAVHVLQKHLAPVQALVGHRHALHMPVVLNGFNDQSNGFVTTLPFRQEIEIAPLRGLGLSPVHTSWFDTVLPYELIHAAHADLRKGIGVAGIIRPFFPDLSRTLNLMIPQGISEGLAVYYESRHDAGAGRLNHSFFNMRFRAAMLSDKPWTMAQLVEAPAYTRPADRFYLGGSHLVDYLARDGGLAFFHRSSALNYRLPLLGYGIGLWYGKKTWPGKIYKNFRTTVVAQEAQFQRERGPFTEPSVVAGRRGLLQRRPLWINNRELLVYASGYNSRSGFYIIDIASGRRRLLRNAQPVGDYAFSLSADRQRLFYAHYGRDLIVERKRIGDVYEIDLQTGRQRRRSEAQRVVAPLEAGAVLWAIQNAGQGSRPVRIEAPGESMAPHAYNAVRFKQLAVSSEGRLAALVNIRGHQGIFWLDAESGRLSPKPAVMFAEGAVYDLSWSSDGRYLIFSADPGGVLNVYVFDALTARVNRLTNARYGAMEGSLSPDGSTLAYIDYQHERYNLVQMPFEPNGIQQLPAAMARYGQALPWMHWATQQWATQPGPALTEARTTTASEDYPPTVVDYQPIRYLAPRALVPILRPRVSDAFGEKEIGYGLGLSLQGADPLQRVRYQLDGYGQAGSFWGQATVQTGGGVVRPFASVYNRLHTIVATRSDESGMPVDQVRVGRQRRGGVAGFRVPLLFESNVFQSGLVFGLQGRLEDERFYISDDEPFTQQVSIEPAASFYYRLQSNARDIIPNNGVALSLSGTYDLRQTAGARSRAAVGRITGYLPFLRRANIGLQVYGRVLMQNRGGIYNLDTFLPRGYEDHVLLEDGGHAVLGLEYVQPLFYVDNGFFMVPLYLKAVYAFGFTEGLVSGNIASANTALQQGPMVSSGAGIGVQFRFLYLLNFEIRFRAAYRYADGRWDFAVH